MAINLVDHTPDVFLGHFLSSCILVAVTLLANRQRRVSRRRLGVVLTLVAPALSFAVHLLIMFVQGDYWVFERFTVLASGPPRYYGLLSVLLPCVLPAAVLVGAFLVERAKE